MKSMFVAALALAAVGCGRQASDTGARPEPTPNPTPHPTWERSAACAQRGDLFAAGLERESRGAPHEVSAWQNHYNARTERCYVLIEYFRGGKPEPGIPVTFNIVWDAFERREVAAFTSHGLNEIGESVWCRQTTEDDKRETSSPPCKEVGQFVARLMRE